MAANRSLGSATDQIKLGDYRRANILLRDGIEELGDVFLGDDVHDDTDLLLGLAHSQEWHGKLQQAAEQRRQVLAGRLAEYAELHDLTDCPSPADSVRMTLVPPKAE